MKPAGENQIILNRATLEPGVYLYTLKAGDWEVTRKMVVQGE